MPSGAQKVSRHRQQALLSIRELVDLQRGPLLLDNHPLRVALHAQVREPGHEPMNSGTHRLQLSILVIRPQPQALLVLEILALPEPFEEEPEVPPSSNQGLIERGQRSELMMGPHARGNVRSSVHRVVDRQGQPVLAGGVTLLNTGDDLLEPSQVAGDLGWIPSASQRQ
jgi:hypothetical protein